MYDLNDNVDTCHSFNFSFKLKTGKQNQATELSICKLVYDKVLLIVFHSVQHQANICITDVKMVAKWMVGWKSAVWNCHRQC